MAESALDVALQVVEQQFAHIDMTVPDSIFDRSRMSLISIKQIVARRMDRLGELDLFRRQVAGGICDN